MLIIIDMMDPIQNQPPVNQGEMTEVQRRPVLNEPTASPFAKTLNEARRQGVREEVYNAVMDSTARYHVSPKLVFAVIRQESGGKSCATSSAGACGVMQLMPETARQLGVKDSYDVRQNVEGGVKYLREMLDRFDGNTDLALAAYNAGPANVEKYGGIPPFAETQNYVSSIKSHLNERSGLGDSREASVAALDQIDFRMLPNLDPGQTSSSPEPVEFAHLRNRV